jgi:hypothetical protein
LVVAVDEPEAGSMGRFMLLFVFSFFLGWNVLMLTSDQAA